MAFLFATSLLVSEKKTNQMHRPKTAILLAVVTLRFEATPEKTFRKEQQ